MNECPEFGFKAIGHNPRPDYAKPPAPTLTVGTSISELNETLKNVGEILHRGVFPATPDISAPTLNSDKTVAVSNDVFWIEDMTTCPLGVKVQLLGLGGVATYGTYDGKDPFWVKWQSVPRNQPAAAGAT